MKTAIIGGGIGGMTLALALHDAGITDLDIYESATDIRELGVGISVQPHAVRELAELGLLGELSEAGIPTGEFSFYSKHGQLIWTEPRGLAAGYKWPQFSIGRGRLLVVLHRAVLSRLGPDCIHTGHHLATFTQSADKVLGEFVNRATQEPVAQVEADFLVGCDGIHSAVRAVLCGDEGPPKWRGITMWRGVTEAQPFLTGRTMISAGYPGRQILLYPMWRDEKQGSVLINWVTNIKTAEGSAMPPQDWDFKASPEEAADPFSNFVFDFLDVPAMIRGAKEVFKYPMVDRDPLPSWDFRNVTLLGDAAHPMYPIGGNGASQTIVDARVLARELARQPSLAMAITAYDKERNAATAAVVRANRQGGPFTPQELVEQRAPDGFASLEDVITAEEMSAIAEHYKRTAGFDIEMLNNRPSFAVR